MQGALSGISKDSAPASLPVAEKREVSSKESAALLRTDFLLIGLLILLEALVFGPFVSKIGFYLDDWVMVSLLRGGPQDIAGAFANYFFNDPKVIIRPIEVLHFGLLYLIFGTKPLGYHLVNAFFEICVCVLLYMALKRFTGSRFLSFVSTAAFILYPIRDSTHYWILCSSVSLSLALYLGSLILSLKGLQENKPGLYIAAALPFAIGLFNYEVFMPFACVSALCVLLMSLRSANLSSSLRQAVYCFIPLFVSALALFGYQRFIVPHLGIGFLHHLVIDPGQILHVISAGVGTSNIFSALPFFREQISVLLLNPLTSWNVFSLALILTGTALTSFFLLITEASQVKLRTMAEIALVGVAAIITSLAIFGLNNQYEPTLMTLVNRIFTGASLGWSFIFSALVLACASLSFHRIKSKLALKSAAIALAGLMSFGAVFFTLVNWQLANPWVVSQRAQQDVIFLVKSLRGKVKPSDSLILTDFPRYVMWSPIFDGVWDFQSMVRIILNEPKMRAGVVSDRLVIGKDDIKDISVGYTCATYPIKDIKLLVPGRNQLMPVTTARQFVDFVEANSAKSLLSADTVGKWQRRVDELEGAAK
ncbi:MAG: hypothetical protein DKT66_03960 [Candidatus Melainabacteria bacterium]|nr:MAG: hypothetical protein DKT66_03960 [Candidatus Melainabacteria bacterium]